MKIDLTSLIVKAEEIYPNTHFREKNLKVHNASSAGQCLRRQCYKKLGYPESNPPDFFSKFSMKFGNYIEAGLKYDVLRKLWVMGVNKLDVQGFAGEYSTFYGASWHGYRDFDLVTNENGQFIRFVAELKSKVGSGANYTVDEYYENPRHLDIVWGYPQQLSLYLRNAYLNTQTAKNPITTGILLFYMYDKPKFGRRIGGYLQHRAEYNPESDTVDFYSGTSAQFGFYELPDPVYTQDLKVLADRWLLVDQAVADGRLLAPEFERKFKIDDPRLYEQKKTPLLDAANNKKIIGDVRCAYCPYKDKCAEDIGLEIHYNDHEVAELKKIAKEVAGRKKFTEKA